MKDGSEPTNLTYRIYYKVMNALNPRAHKYDYRDKTVLLETNLLKSDIAIPKTIMLKDITPPSTWLLEAVAPSAPIESKKVEEIIQFQDVLNLIFYRENKDNFTGHKENTKERYRSANKGYLQLKQTLLFILIHRRI